MSVVFGAISSLSRDLKAASATLSDEEARFLVDAYYIIQEDRKRSSNQVRALDETEEPHSVLQWFSEQSDVLEQQIRRALDAYSSAQPVGRWARSVIGIGPVIAAGLLAHIDITKAPTVGHIWRYAGLDPTSHWEKGQKRPWNAALKVLCWKIGESFVKTAGHKSSVYGPVYRQRKDYEWRRNFSGDYAGQASATLERKRIGKDTEAYRWYSGAYDSARMLAVVEGGGKVDDILGDLGAFASDAGTPMLPPAHIHARAKRYAVKLFLAHLHEVWYEQHFGTKPPLPYPLAHMGHAHKIEPPR